MDSFVRRFFPQFDAPGAAFVYDQQPFTFAYMGATLRVDDTEIVQNRNFVSSQPMTPMGRVKSTVSGGSSSLDGMNRSLLTPEGTINLSALADSLKTTAGLQNHVLSGHVAKMNKWDWADNHTALILNMLRYVLIRRIDAEMTTGYMSFGDYSDGHVSIDMDQWWTNKYPYESKLRSWPGGDDIEDYPTYMHTNESTVADDNNCIDLRGLSASEARFVLLMAGPWNRRSRLRLDFETAALTKLLRYRSSVGKVSNIGEGAADEPGKNVADDDKLPEPIGWQAAWMALKGYVTQNRCYDHFSTALFLICGLMYQMVPVTAESTAWLTEEWVVSIPQFRAIRGRYEILNEGEPALVSHRALSEWGYINGKLEKINLMALVFSQACQTGMAVRSIRKGLELDPTDLYNSEADFYHTANFISAAAAEAVRGEVPLPGMTGVNILVGFRFDEPDEDRWIVTKQTSDDGLDGYQTEVNSSEITEYSEEEMDPNENPTNSSIEKKIYIDEMKRAKREAEIALEVNPEAILTRLQRLSLEGKTVVPVARRKKENRVSIAVPWMTFAGMPTLILPLSPFPYNTILSLKGEIDDTIGELGRKNISLSPSKAWLLASLQRLCGYDVRLRDSLSMSGANRFFAPNDVHFSWPIMMDQDKQDEKIVVEGNEQRDHFFIELPPMHNKFFKGRKVQYQIKVQRRGVSESHVDGREDIDEFGGSVSMHKETKVVFTASEAILRLRGYISRDESGFRFANAVQAGVIPQAMEANPVPTAEQEK